MSISLNEFNTLPIAAVQQLLNNCVHIPSWANHLAARRPFQSLPALYSYAEQLSQQWTWDEIKNALDQHPKIGQKTAKHPLTPQEQNFSAKEQGSIQLNSSTAQALAEGNIAYENQFGHIFLIRAAGRSAEQILAELQRRLNNSPEAEQKEVSNQLAQIALLRLQQEITQ